jgi:hypothetical protein
MATARSLTRTAGSRETGTYQGNHRRPPTTPSASTFRSLSGGTSAASLATSVAESTETPTSAVCSATASLTPCVFLPRKLPPRPLTG